MEADDASEGACPRLRREKGGTKNRLVRKGAAGHRQKGWVRWEENKRAMRA